MASKITPQNTSEDSYADELQPGAALLHGQYEIAEFLNNGGFGITYLAKDSLHRMVVIKECFPESMCSRVNSTVRVRSRSQAETFRTIVELFIEEARNLARLSHPNIVGVHQVFEDNDTAYMAMDFVEGRDLLSIAEGQETLEPETLERVVLQLLDAVEFMHKEGILHRDIAPDNILLSKNNEPVLIDFGAARDNVSRAASYLASMRTVKDGYSPQEFYINSPDQHPSSDLYSLAASLYHVMSKELPVSAQTRMTAIAGGDDDPYVSIKDRVSGHSDAFLEAIDRALKVFPKDRIQSAAEWRAMLVDSGAARGSVSRPMLAVENGNILKQFQGVAARAISADRSLMPKRSRPRSGDESVPASRTSPSERTKNGAMAPIGTSSSGSDSKTPYMAFAAVALVALVAGGAFMIAGGETDATTGTSDAGAVPPQEMAANDVPNAPSTVVSDQSRKPEQMPFFLAGESEGDVTVTSASGTLASGGTASLTPEPPTAVADAGDAPSSSFTELLDLEQSTIVEDPVTPSSDFAVLSTPSSTSDAQGLSPVISAKGVSLPIEVDPTDPTLIASVSGDIAGQLEPGMRILSVNGFPLETISDFQRVLDATTEYDVGDEVSVSFGMEDPRSGQTSVRTLILPSHRQTMLLNGMTFKTSRTEGAWSTIVESAPGDDPSKLRAGDRIVALMPSNELIDQEDSLERILLRDIESGVTQFNFAVTRDDEMWFAEMHYNAN